jgi:hypothetical protein
VEHYGAEQSVLFFVLAWEVAGVEFIPADAEKGPGLRLKRKVRGKRAKRVGLVP